MGERRTETPIEDIAKEYENTKRQHDTLIKEIKERYNPEFESFIETKKITYEEIKELLDDKTALIEFFITEERPTAFIVRKERRCKGYST